MEALNRRGIEPVLRVDASGVGEPMIDVMVNQLADLKCFVSRVTITAGESVDGNAFSHRVHVSKLFLVSRLTALIETGRVRLPKRDRHIEAMIAELENFRFRATDAGGFSAAARSGAYDDLISALALATLFDSSSARVMVGPSPYQ